MKKSSSVLKEVLKQIEPSKEDIKEIESSLKIFLERLNKNAKTFKMDVDIFVGGSYSKGTMIRRNFYDIDIFVRFDKKHKEEELSKLTKKLLKGLGKFTTVHGSRDYFQIKIAKNLVFEIVPVRKIKSLKEAENITDRSYSHVHYINRKIKNRKIKDDVRLAKSFCHANDCYGAESYVNGFSGYALELLVYKYNGFLNFLKAMTKIKGKEIIDIEKQYKNKSQIMMDLNAAKLDSPIILIDPTFKQRNALAALNEETFRKFQKSCVSFLKNPSLKYFEEKVIDIEKIKKDAKKKNFEFILLRAETSKQEGDVAGSKLWKFQRHLEKEIGKFFEVKGSGFEYKEGKKGRYFFLTGKKKDNLAKGPLLKQEKHEKNFKKKHKNTFVKSGRLYSKIKPKSSLKKFLQDWIKENTKKIKEMNIVGLSILD